MFGHFFGLIGFFACFIFVFCFYGFVGVLNVCIFILFVLRRVRNNIGGKHDQNMLFEKNLNKEVYKKPERGCTHTQILKIESQVFANAIKDFCLK